MIAQLLKTERLKKGLTQKKLAEMSGISFVAINRIEKGNLPRLSVAIKIFAALDKKLNIIVEDEDVVLQELMVGI
jgi:transcriptional regulator with XRE-family HTH domain